MYIYVHILFSMTPFNYQPTGLSKISRILSEISMFCHARSDLQRDLCQDSAERRGGVADEVVSGWVFSRVDVPWQVHPPV